MKKTHNLYGWHAAEAAIKYTPEKVIAVWMDVKNRHQRHSQFLKRLDDRKIKVLSATSDELIQLSDGGHHQGIVLKVDLPPQRGENDLKKLVNANTERPFFLILDRIQDPQNLGSCLRTADAVGIQGVIIPKDRSVGLSPTVYKVASGAADSVPIFRVTNLVRTMEWLKKTGIWLFGADGSAHQSIYDADLTLPMAVVVGTEGKGLRRLIRDHCDFIVKLPMVGRVESLNLAVATGAFLYEAVRQRIIGVGEKSRYELLK